MKRLNRISIIGVGLIGGSLALALKQAYSRLRIIGYDRAPVLKQALKLGAIDEAATDLLSAVIQSDCIVFATPISTTLDLLRSVGKFISPGTIVSDVCSVKVPVEKVARKFLPNGVLFVGGHPMAGSENSGIDNADPLMFENAYYVLCVPKVARRSDHTRKELLKAFIGLIESTGGRVIFLDAALHDRIVASVSHIPQLLAVALMNLSAKESDSRSLQLAAGGFRDLTRVASSLYSIWDDIFRMNKKEISRSLEKLIRQLRMYQDSINLNRLENVRDQFVRAKNLRDAIPKDMKGFHRPLVDVLVSVEDKPGAISKISSALYRHHINIKDMELLKVREGEMGTFRLSFETEKVAKQAMKILDKAGFRAAKR